MGISDDSVLHLKPVIPTGASCGAKMCFNKKSVPMHVVIAYVIFSNLSYTRHISRNNNAVVRVVAEL